MSNYGALNWQPMEENEGARQACTHTHTHSHSHTPVLIITVKNIHTPTHPPTRTAGLTGNAAVWNKQALPVCTEAHSQSTSNPNPMSSPLHHYQHHSAGITAHLLIARRLYLFLESPVTPNTHHSPSPCTDDLSLDLFLSAEVRFSFKS